jgi:PhnB protein
LCRAFGFKERMRYPMPDGRIGHAELEYAGSTLMLASPFEGFGTSPLKLDNVHGSVYCVVEDIDAHYARARAAGVTVVGEVVHQHGVRSYRAIDPEGHRWIFATPEGADAVGNAR